ncbi:MAG: glycoside hydrolase family protein [Brevundimonas sp.]|uniref:glycoside hydrolase family protein n=1 Tax=Brevundimonas sp. TaxID=1871086 RepID=UPI00403496F5
MKISREGVLLIKSFEGFRPRAQLGSDGCWIVGYGHTASAREGATISEAEAELLLQYDLIPVQTALVEGLTRPVNQHQYDALASFAFSVGTEAFRASDVLARVNSGAETQAAEALVAWPEPPVRDAGLRRRAAERALFKADPASAVTLSDLLVAPVSGTEPSPAPEAPASKAPAAEIADEVPIFAPEAPAVAFEVAANVGQTGSVLSVAQPADPAAEVSPPSVTALTPSPADVIQGALSVTAVPATSTSLAADPVTGAVAPSQPVTPGVLDEAAAQGELQTTGVLAEGAALTTPRLVWPDGQGANVSFENQGRLDPVNDRDVPTEPIDAGTSGFSWGRVWAYLVMGGFGLVSLAMSMAALRMASMADTDTTSILAIAGVLAAIGAICVGVSAYNIYQRLSDDR